MARIEKSASPWFCLLLPASAFATTVYQTPTPIAGLGIVAVALVGLGYRALKKRINP